MYVTLTLSLGRGLVPVLTAQAGDGEARCLCRGWRAFAAFNRTAAGLADAQGLRRSA